MESFYLIHFSAIVYGLFGTGEIGEREVAKERI
jgi:hypothetical protein